MPTENTTKNRTSGKTIETLEGVDTKNFNRAKDFWSAQKKAGRVLRPEWYNLGEVFRDAKNAFDGNTKKFGAWREKHFPGMAAPFASCAQTVALHKEVIEKWASKECPAVNNPMTLLRRHQSDTQIRLKSDGTMEKIVAPEVAEPDNSAAKTEGGVEMLFEAFRKSANALREIKLSNVPDGMKAMIADVNAAVGNWLISGEEIKSDNPLVESKVIDDLEKTAEIKKEMQAS